MVQLQSWTDFGTEDSCLFQSGHRLSQQCETAMRIFPLALYEKLIYKK